MTEALSSQPFAQGFEKITVIGAGLIGGSVLMAVRSVYPDLPIRAVDPDSETLQYAVRSNLADEVSLTLPVSFEGRHLVVLACHLSTSMEVLRDLTPRLSETALVTDVGSCKRAICGLGETLLPGRFIGGHPMAGRESSGIAHATPLLFSGKPWVLCPAAGSGESFNDLKTFISGFGAVIQEMDPPTHDRLMAFNSHFPQLYAVLLGNLLYKHQPGQLLALPGEALLEQLRLAASPYELWRDVFEYNKDNLVEVLRAFGEMAGSIGQDLGQPAMSSWFDRANRMATEFREAKGSLPLSL